MRVDPVLKMSFTIFGLFILLMTSLQNAGADVNRKLMLSDDQYLNVVVFFWQIIPEYDDQELLGHGALITSNWILTTKACHEMISKSDQTVISTGSSYFDDIDINFVISTKVEFTKKSKVVILVIDVHIGRSSSIQLVHKELTWDREYSAVLVGWNLERDQPMIEPFRLKCSIRGRFYMTKDNENQSELNSSAGGLVIINKDIIALADSAENHLYLNKITCSGPSKVTTELSKRKREDTILQWQSNFDSNTGIAPVNYDNILVSLWRMVSDTEYDILCLGALIQSHLIFATTQCSEMLNPHENVGVLTGVNNPSDTPEKMISETRLLRKNSEFTILILNRNIELSSSISIGVVTTPIHQTNEYGVFLGWNKQRGRINKPFHYRNEEKLLLVSEVESYNDEDFPPGSIAIKGRYIIGFTHLEKRNNVDRNVMVRETTTCEKKIEFSKILFEDFTEVHSVIRKSNNNYGDLTDHDYFNFVVSLWAKNISEAKTPEEIEQKEFDLLCLGALFHEEAVLINQECHEELCRFSLDDIGVLTKSMLPNQPKTRVFNENRSFRAGSFYRILHTDQDFMRSSHIRLDWWEEDNTEKINGVLIGWSKEEGPVKESFHCSGSHMLFIPLSQIKNRLDFPPGSLVIMGKNFRASTIAERIFKKEEERGVLKITKREGYNFIWTYKYLYTDSRKARQLLRKKKRSTKGASGTREIGSSIKKHRLL